MKVRSISPDYRKNTQDERKYGPSAVSAGKEGGLHRGPVSLSDIREKGVSINPGGLPPGMQQSDLGHRSVRRNPIIADLFHRIGFIEKAGTGIRRMRKGAREIGYPEPEFKVGSFFSVIFLSMIRTENEDSFPDGTKWALSLL